MEELEVNGYRFILVVDTRDELGDGYREYMHELFPGISIHVVDDVDGIEGELGYRINAYGKDVSGLWTSIEDAVDRTLLTVAAAQRVSALR